MISRVEFGDGRGGTFRVEAPVGGDPRLRTVMHRPPGGGHADWEERTATVQLLEDSERTRHRWQHDEVR